MIVVSRSEMTMHRRRATVSIALPFLLIAALATGCERGSVERQGVGSTLSDRPNVLLITIESLRPDHVGCYGGLRATTPALDALSAEGITFENAHSVTSWTLAAHASLFTGLYPTAANIVYPRDRLDASYQTLAEVLGGIGYDTAAVVSGLYLRRSFGLDQGFAMYDDSAVAPADTSSIDDVTNPQMEAALVSFLEGRRDVNRRTTTTSRPSPTTPCSFHRVPNRSTSRTMIRVGAARSRAMCPRLNWLT
jgi:hypothetical protein